ncbi:unnamed protein product [Clonostachys rosea]|uniref:NACHT domain-containing protein n=1 Tax=Bionectria ochroleuca TaxID=29856 RepID=A0ABY6U488_BIOOC|nr:unnamed protein product [Clonostachys rosea]
MSGVEAVAAVTLVRSIIKTIESIKETYDAVKHASGLPEKVHSTAQALGFIHDALDKAEKQLNKNTLSDDENKKAKQVLETCKEKLEAIKNIFDNHMPKGDSGRLMRLRKAAWVELRNKGREVEENMTVVGQQFQLLAGSQIFEDAKVLQDIQSAIEDLQHTSDEEKGYYFHNHGTGSLNPVLGTNNSQYNNFGGGHFNTGEVTYYQGPPGMEAIDRNCRRALLRSIPRYDPKTLRRNLIHGKGKLVKDCLQWIFSEEAFTTWHTGNSISLLLIKGGPGMGKTMMALAIIDNLEQGARDDKGNSNGGVAYAFCQGDNAVISSIATILTGLVLRLMDLEPEASKVLREKWDDQEKRYDFDLSSWRALWNVLLDMLDCCSSPLFLIVDALDECTDDIKEVAELLERLVRIGLRHPERLKWLITSRPSVTVNQGLLGTPDQVLISLDLHTHHVSMGVKKFVKEKVSELNHKLKYDREPNLRESIEKELIDRSKDTFLWVHLVCKQLEDVSRQNALDTIRREPRGLKSLYKEEMTKICATSDAQKCVKILQAMILALQPLHMSQLSSICDVSENDSEKEDLIELCASFLRCDENGTIFFIHQSAREYAAHSIGGGQLTKFGSYSHAALVIHCLGYLENRLSCNLLKLDPLNPKDLISFYNLSLSFSQREKMSKYGYAARFWARHLMIATKTEPNLLNDAQLLRFLEHRLLEWIGLMLWYGEHTVVRDVIIDLRDLTAKLGPKSTCTIFVFGLGRPISEPSYFVQQIASSIDRL